MTSLNTIFLTLHVPVCQSLYSCTKHHDPEASWGGKGLFSLCFHIAVHHQRKSGQELTQGRNLEAGADAEAMEGYYLLDCFPLACSACFLIESRTTSPGMAPLTMGPPTLDH